MGAQINTRNIILDILIEINEKGAYSDKILGAALRKYQYLPHGDRAFISRTVMGSVERRLTLDYVADGFSKVPVAKMKPVIRNILRMSIYQLLYMGGVEDFAACGEAVKLAEKRGFSSLKGFVNGILRNIARARDKKELPMPDVKDRPAFLSVKYSTPEWIVDKWIRAYGEEDAEKILASQYEERPLTIRCNTSRITPGELAESLRSHGIRVQDTPFLPEALYIEDYDYLEKTEEFRDGLFSVQDISSMLVGHAAKPAPGAYVIDLCAAPGGKSLHIAELLKGTGHVEARDITEAKVSLIEEGIKRLGLRNISASAADARLRDGALAGKADVVIADLPCSGLGIIGRKPDIKYNASPEGCAELAGLQREILAAATEYVKPGGLLVYSTCTLNPEENTGNAVWFAENFDFEPEPAALNEFGDIRPRDTGRGFSELLPGVSGSGFDGFFIAVFRRKIYGNGMKASGNGMKESGEDRIKNQDSGGFLTDIKSLTLEELEGYLAGLGQPAFRAKQLYEWMHVKLEPSYDGMTNLPAGLRRQLAKETEYTSLETVKLQVSKEDGTAKYLFRLGDGNLIESVLMRYHHGNSVCVSSQAGCRMGCRFCASTIDGLARNLKPSEMLDQIYRIQRDTGERVTNVVVMGSGEPFDNFDNFVRFERLLTDARGLNISARNLTVSTCGIVPRIYELADMRLQLTLAVSLHAPNDEIRRRLMPIANRYSVGELMEACRYYADRTGRRITFEYSLVKGENDSPQCAAELAGLVDGLNCHINLIPVNPVKERNFRQSDASGIAEFKNILEKYRKNVTIRRELGRDIDGACGQLRKRYSDGI